MLVWIVVTSIVAHPHIITSSSKLESWSEIWRIDYPLDGAIFNTMLKQDNWCILLSLSWDSMHIKNISITCNNLMVLKFESILFNDLLDIMLSVINIGSLKTWSLERSVLGSWEGFWFDVKKLLRRHEYSDRSVFDNTFHYLIVINYKIII